MVKHHKPRMPSQNWKTFIKNHSCEIYACDFFTEFTALFTIFHVFIVMELGSRRIIHFNITKNPTLPWVKQQIREANSWDNSPRFLIHDNDGIFGQYRRKRKHYRSNLDQWLSEIMNIKGIPTPYGAPNANSFCERLIGSMRRECLDHMIIFNELHLFRILKKYTHWYNHGRYHQGIEDIPEPDPEILEQKLLSESGKFISIPVLNGLLHDYRLVA